ncbi:MAG: xanthine dehydrogenase family protein molybdopterin-binding subunit [Acidimicrobiia bacterium]|nr:xanthine dehydrogenase family protein molybdopterin-binding subunit [Acidimicrobiia bacterium]
MSILGNPVVRSEDPRFLTTGGRYAADLKLPDAAHVVFVRSTASAGTIISIETDEAREAPGVLAVLTGTDLDLGPFSNPKSDVWCRWPLATERVRFAGEPVVVVVAETYAQALDAAELVWVDVEAVDAVPTIKAALDGPARVYPELPDNVVDDKRADDLDFSDCEIVVDVEIANNRINGAPIEARVAAAKWTDDGRLTCWTSTQGAHPAQARIAAVMQLDAADVHVITTDVGGSFGSKAGPGPEECTLGAVARAVGRPVVWAETRTENFLAMGHARSQLNRVRLGGTADGTLTHYQLDITAEAGAYPQSTNFLPYFTSLMATGVYDIANAACGWMTVVTNTVPIVAFRGAGRPEATATIERAIDLFANRAGLDPAELRRKNMPTKDRFPFTSAMGQVYDSGDYHAALESSLDTVGYADLRAEQARRIEAGHSTLLGVGMSSYVEITAPGAIGTDNEFGSVELLEGGRVLARTGSTPYGQGHETTWAMVISDRLGIPIDKITVVWGDTDEVDSSKISGGSRSVQLAGSAMADASVRLIDASIEHAATLLEASPADIVFDAAGGVFHVAGTPARTIAWDALAAAAPQALLGVSEFSQTGATYPFGAHVAVVEVDVRTGHVNLLRMVTTDDAGTLINPLIALGQVHGGVAAGISQALFEEVTYDEYGNLTSANFADYALPAASEYPMFEVTLTETPTPLNPLGAKGIGEAGSIGATPAVHNAVIDALRHVGVEHLDLPLTPSKVWAAYTNALAASPT